MPDAHTLIIDIGNSEVKYYFKDRSYCSLNDLLIAGNLIGMTVDIYIISTDKEKLGEVIDSLEQSVTVNSIEIFDVDKQGLLEDTYPGLGADRVAKLIGALALFPDKDVVLMDFGTATTVSIASYDYKFKGGFIGLGLQASLKALSESCDALRDYSRDQELGDLIDNYDMQSINMHQSTKQAMIYGTYTAHIGLVAEWLHRAKKVIETHGDGTKSLMTICTGGEAGYFDSYFDVKVDSSKLLQAFVTTVTTVIARKA